MTNLEITNAYIGDIEAIRLYLGDNLVYGTEPEPEEDPMLRTPLTFEFIEQGTGTTHGIGLRLTGVTSTAERDQYRRPLMYVLTHNGEKTTGYLDLTEDVSSSAVTSLMTGLTLGDTVEFYAKEKQGALAASTVIYEMITYYTGDKYAVYGNVNSLLVTKDEFDDFDNATFIASAYTFHGLFSNKTALDFGTPSSEKHILLPEPTNGLQESCYSYMFQGCSSLTTAPALPATTLATACYDSMFWGCTGLTTAPALPATTLADKCYYGMFYGCRKLDILDCRATDITASACTAGWVSYVASSGTFVKDPNMTSWTRGTNGIPTNWTVIDAVGIQLPETYKKVWEDESGVKTIAILPFENWTASTSDDWITFDKTTGTSKDRSFSFNYTTTDEGRTGTITFTTNSNSVTFTLYQNDLNNRLTFNILSDGRITWKKTETAAVSGWNVSLYYRKNDAASWSTLNISSPGTSINVSAGDTLEFAAYGTSQTLARDTTMYCWLGDSTAQFEARGNIMSLLSANDYSGATTLESAYTFYGLFSGCTALTSAEKLILPATKLTNYCYRYMFDGCTSLTTAPELPATTLADYCYTQMFADCASLTTAPKLPATTLATNCYYGMFQRCSSLTTAPALPATILAERCYGSMFYGCTTLTTPPELPATTLTKNCYNNMFAGCTSLTTAPELPATTLADSCYWYMFYGCTNLNYIKCLATDISASNCTKDWVLNVASAGTFEGVPSTEWASGNNGVPEGWTTNIPLLKVSVLEIELFNQGDTASLDVSSTLPWSATSIPSWVSLSQTEGNSGLTTITITAITIPSTEVKDTLTITNTYKTVSITITNEQKDYSKMPLTFEMLSAGTIYWRPETSLALTFEYSLNDGPWTRAQSSVSIDVERGDKVQFKGDNIRLATSSSRYSHFDCEASFNAYGNIMSLLDSTGYTTATTLESANTFVGLFMNCRGLISAENLVLPATTLKNYCYNRLFRECSNLLRGPELSLEVLNANGCYQHIFYGCSSLNYIKCLATNVTGTTYTNNWVTGVGTSGTFVKHPGAGWTTGTSGIPDGWTVVDATE